VLTRPIPRTGEPLPVIGLGTWQVFDVGAEKQVRAPLAEVLAKLLAAGARVIDSSPMYGRAEQVVGDELARLAWPGTAPTPFLATKVWTTGRAEGIAQMRRSMERLRATHLDLMQIHNLVDWQTHLPVLREWKAAGTIRYVGVTHYQHAALPTIERLIREEHLDFVQVPYSIVDRTVEARVLPAARDTGTAVLVMTPFESGALLQRLRDTPVPEWATRELGCTSWAQLLLKWLLGHPAVTCPLAATGKPAHVADNLAAGAGALPDEAQRERLRQAIV
jgi:diketogulonate reductase-like aldo/keto reductase